MTKRQSTDKLNPRQRGQRARRAREAQERAEQAIGRVHQSDPDAALVEELGTAFGTFLADPSPQHTGYLQGLILAYSWRSRGGGG